MPLSTRWLRLKTALSRLSHRGVEMQRFKASQRHHAYALQRQLRSTIEAIGSDFFDLAEGIPEETVANCRVFAHRNRAIECLPTHGVVAEVGTQSGRFADHIFRTSQPKRLHLFDLSTEWFDKTLLVEPLRAGGVTFHLGDSSANLKTFEDEYFDWMYIDGDHAYDGVKRDIAESVRTVKRDGVLVFNDYTMWSPFEVTNYGVMKAVNELVNGGGWEFVYIALSAWGYHDVALRRRH